VPIHSHNGAEGLKPERVNQPSQKLLMPIIDRNGRRDHSTQARHALDKPGWIPVATQRLVAAVRTTKHQDVSIGAASWQSTHAAAGPNNGKPCLFRRAR